jgi:hypothetical protein
MGTVGIDEAKLKDVLKEAIIEVLEERRNLLDGLLEDALLDIGLAAAIEDGLRTPEITRSQVFEILKSAA